jgi:site-specific DNA-methyltransferase (adenine-specific)
MTTETGPGWELRLGRWQDVLADVTACDALITDPPYSERTHAGERGLVRDPEYDPQGNAHPRNAIAYQALDPLDAYAIAEAWAPRTHHWAVVFGDAVMRAHHVMAWHQVGWYTFAPVVYVKRDAPPRFSGDGPTSSCEYLQVCRRKCRLPTERMGSRPGHYLATVVMARDGNTTGFVGAKDIAVMRAIIRDYTLPGDLIVDSYAGTGMTLLAAAIEGRRAIGAECDPDHYALAVKRLRRGYTEAML